jgi:thioredoxin-related protein
MNRIIISIVSLLAIATFFSFVNFEKSAKNAPSEDVKWVTLEEAEKLQKKKPKKIMIDVYTNWCLWCKKMDKATFQHKDIAKYLNDNYYSVKLNAESDRELEFNGEKTTERKVAQQIFRVSSYPTTVYLDEKAKVITAVPGYWEPKNYDVVLHYFSENHYKGTSWEDFQAKFQSKIN